MRVAIVHYHLQPGGVTSVIHSAVAALSRAGIASVVLTGEAGNHPLDSATREIPGLGYLDRRGDFTAAVLIDALRHAAAEALGGPPDLWHFHNHSLGKNCLLPDVVAQLADEGERLVLQIHDLAEDGRPANYPLIAGRDHLYPIAPGIHYTFLNRRDRDVFTAAGLPPECATVLPNPVVADPSTTTLDASRPAILFAPIRGIRRKNLGELVLLAALSPPNCAFAISRAPTNPAARPIHETWQRFARSHGFRIEFDVVDQFAPAADATADFASWIDHATHFVTTSVAEGFGLPFLEAVAAGKPLIGRDLPMLTAELEGHGIHAGRLYQRILVPLDWLTLSILRDHFATTLERTFRAYRRPLRDWEIQASFEDFTASGSLDFGNLPEPLQQAVIEKAAEQQDRADLLVESAGQTEPLVDWLARAIAAREPLATPADLVPFSLETYQQSLTTLYSELLAQPVTSVRHFPQDRILAAFLDPKTFHFLLSALPPTRPPAGKFRAAIFDIYGTLQSGPPGAIQPDLAADPRLRQLLETAGYPAPPSPTTALHSAVVRHHAAAGFAFPEIDLRDLWREVLELGPEVDLLPLIEATEAAWHPTDPMPGAAEFVQRLARAGISLGLLSNAQVHTLSTLGGIADLFPPELTILSYQHGIAKPAPDLFQLLADRLAARGILPHETLFIGNDPRQDILPAAAAGFKTALFTGHPDSLRDGECTPDIRFETWDELHRWF